MEETKNAKTRTIRGVPVEVGFELDEGALAPVAAGHLRAAIGAGLLLGTVVLAFVVFIELRWNRTFEAPLPELRASEDAAVIERGRYLAYGPAHCVDCHAAVDQRHALRRGEQPPLSEAEEPADEGE